MCSYILEPSLTTDSNLSRFLETWWQKSRYLYIKTTNRLIPDCTWAIFNIFSNYRPPQERQGLLGVLSRKNPATEYDWFRFGNPSDQISPRDTPFGWTKQPIWLICVGLASVFWSFLSFLPLTCSKWWQVTFKVSKKEGYIWWLRFLKSLLHVRDLFWSKWLFEWIHGHAGRCCTYPRRGNDLMICALASNLKTCCFS